MSEIIAYISCQRKGIHKGRYVWIAFVDGETIWSTGSRATKTEAKHDLMGVYQNAQLMSKYKAIEAHKQQPARGGQGETVSEIKWEDLTDSERDDLLTLAENPNAIRFVDTGLFRKGLAHMNKGITPAGRALSRAHREHEERIENEPQ